MTSFVQKRLTTLLILLIAGGFAVIVVELIWTRHYEGAQLIGFGASIIGLLLMLAGLVVRGKARMFLAGALVVLAVAGLMGVWEHAEARAEQANRRFPGQRTQTNGQSNTQPNDQTGEQAQPPANGQNDETAPNGQFGPRAQGGPNGQFPGGFRGPQGAPLVAPLSLSGLGLMGAVLLIGTRDMNESDDE